MLSDILGDIDAYNKAATDTPHIEKALFIDTVEDTLAQHKAEPTIFTAVLVHDVLAHLRLVAALEREYIRALCEAARSQDPKPRATADAYREDLFKARLAMRKSIADLQESLRLAGTPIPTGPAATFLSFRDRGMPDLAWNKDLGIARLTRGGQARPGRALVGNRADDQPNVAAPQEIADENL